MEKHVCSALLWLDETKALGRVVKFYCPTRHFRSPVAVGSPPVLIACAVWFSHVKSGPVDQPDRETLTGPSAVIARRPRSGLRRMLPQFSCSSPRAPVTK